MDLDESQKKKVAGWIAEGLKLSEIQSRIASDLGVRLTYMDVRLLVDDLKLTPKDSERPKVAAPALSAGVAPGPNPPVPAQALADPGPDPVAPAAGEVTVSVDQIARAGAVVSGNVTFSDGNKAEWYFDQSGRLGLASPQPSYRPPPADLQRFQALLEAELSRLGY